VLGWFITGYNPEMERLEKVATQFHWRRRLLQLVILGVALLFAMSMMGQRPENLGTLGGKLYSCPTSPNCVSTTAEKESQRMECLVFTGDAQAAMAKLVEVVSSMPRSRVISQTENYLYVEFSSLLFRFVDDVEFLIDAENNKIDFRSASRVGYSDMGANRRRMTTLSNRFLK